VGHDNNSIRVTQKTQNKHRRTYRKSFDAQVCAFLWYAVHHSAFDVTTIEVEKLVSAIDCQHGLSGWRRADRAHSCSRTTVALTVMSTDRRKDGEAK